MTPEKTLNFEYSCLLGVYWASNGIAFNFAAVFLQDRGYTNYAIGLIFSVCNFLAFATQPLLAGFIDRRNKKPLMACSLAIAAVTTLTALASALLGPSGAVLSVCYVLMLATSTILQPLTNSASTYLNTWGFEIRYSRARAVGSLCFALSMLLVGVLCERVSPIAVPVSYSFIAVFMVLLLALFMRQDKTLRTVPPKTFDNKAKAASSLGKFISDNRRFCIYLIGISLLFFSHMLVGNFFIEFLRPLGGDSGDMGNIFCLMALTELPAMLLFDRLTRRFGCAALLRFSALMFVVKALAYRLAPSVGMMYAAACLQSLSFAVFIPASVRYVEEAIKKRDSVKGQSFTTCMITFGCILASYFGGLMLDTVGTEITLTVGVLAAAAGAAFVFPGVKGT